MTNIKFWFCKYNLRNVFCVSNQGSFLVLVSRYRYMFGWAAWINFFHWFSLRVLSKGSWYWSMVKVNGRVFNLQFCTHILVVYLHEALSSALPLAIPEYNSSALLFEYRHSIHFPAYANPKIGSDRYMGYWVALNEMTGTLPGTWKWEDGTLLSYNQWATKQPNSAGDRNVILWLTPPTFGFNDRKASLTFNIICEKHVWNHDEKPFYTLNS